MNMQRERQRRGLVILASILCLFLLTACNKELPALSSKFDPVKVEEKAKSVIALVNDRDGQTMREMGTEEIKQSLTDEAMKPVYDALQKAGAFKEIKDIQLAGNTDSSGQEYAVFVAKAVYEKKSFIVTITFTPDMKLSGLFFK
ncbi:DUF3887 domain-containing protein [Desulfitobacterium sp. PCE1]|uniref:DUF3887 domain-containing protein n=1 Tax=Desulfitobacterium sp. PCE1 TaxID=146907 RepID=UPI0003820434|nr:DUF3887 domain-containing protein [Desulfitobacterium sp. PCE1]